MFDTTTSTINTISQFVATVLMVLAFFKIKPQGLKKTWAVLKRVSLSVALGVAAWLLLYGAGTGLAAVSHRISHGRPTTTTQTPATTSTTIPPDVPIKFTSPKPNRKDPPHVGRETNIRGSGTIPEDMHLWVFVYAPDQKLYYAAGEATVLPDFWSGHVVIGGDAKQFPGDINAPFVIYAVLADAKAHATIKEAFDKNQGTVGTPKVPGGAGARKVAYVTVIRVR